MHFLWRCRCQCHALKAFRASGGDEGAFLMKDRYKLELGIIYYQVKLNILRNGFMSRNVTIFSLKRPKLILHLGTVITFHLY